MSKLILVLVFISCEIKLIHVKLPCDSCGITHSKQVLILKET
jgi:hypothetical protein